jgi:hypothetical protein
VTLSAGNDGILGNSDDELKIQTTDINGKYLFKDLCQYRFRLQRLKYDSRTINVNLAAGQ